VTTGNEIRHAYHKLSPHMMADRDFNGIWLRQTTAENDHNNCSKRIDG